MIQEYRKHLDAIDDKVASLLLERLQIVKKIGDEKKKQGIAVLDKGREDKIKERLSRLCEGQHEKDYVLAIYEKIMMESKNMQK